MASMEIITVENLCFDMGEGNADSVSVSPVDIGVNHGELGVATPIL